MRLTILFVAMVVTWSAAGQCFAQSSHWNDWARRQGFGYSDGYHVSSRCGWCGAGWQPMYGPVIQQPTPAMVPNAAAAAAPAAAYAPMGATAAYPMPAAQPMFPQHPSMLAQQHGYAFGMPAPTYMPQYPVMPQNPVMSPYGAMAPQVPAVAATNYGMIGNPVGWSGPSTAPYAPHPAAMQQPMPMARTAGLPTLPSGPPYPETDSPLVTLTPRPLPKPTIPASVARSVAPQTPQFTPYAPYGVPSYPAVPTAYPAIYGYGNAPLMRLP